MRRIIVALLIVLIVFAFCGCGDTSDTETSLNQNTFHMTKCYDDDVVQIYRHEETGVYYLGGSSYRAGWCVMVNADGTPYTGEE